MNTEDLRKNLRELSGKQKDNLRKRKGLIREMKTLPYPQRQNFKKTKLNDGQPSLQVAKEILINLEGSKEQRNEKQKENDAKAPEESRLRDKRMFGNALGHLKRAKKLLDSQEQTLQKQYDITRRVDEKDKKETQDLKETQDKRKESLFQERKELEKELAQDEFKRQQLMLQLQFVTMQEFFITKCEPYILWKPAKMNEGLNTLKKESVLKLKEMEQILKEKLLNSFKLFTDRDSIRIVQKDQAIQENPEHHESSQTEDEESESHHQQKGEEEEPAEDQVSHLIAVAPQE